MARRKRGFDWVREDQDEEAREWAVRRDQIGMKKLRDRKKALALRMADLPEAAVRALPIEAFVADAVVALSQTPPTPARKRQRLRVVGLLGDTDLDALEAALDGEGPLDALLRDAERWRTRILDGGDEEAFAFAQAHAEVDVQQLRQLARGARGEGSKASKASKRIFQMVKDALLAAEE